MTIKKRCALLTLMLSLVLTGIPGVVQAVCDQSSASLADQDLWGTHGCWEEFYLWEYQAYDLRDDDWGGRGWDDACNVNLEFPKHWNAAWVLGWGLADNNDLSFHHSELDYERAGSAPDNAFHDDIYHSPTDDTSVYGRWIWHPFDSNEIQTSCLLYDSTDASANNNPGSRGGDYIHEGWHGWMDKYDWDNGSCGGHRCGPQNAGDPNLGACSAPGCDYFYFHGIGAYAFGAMWENDGTGNRFHSPNQVQVEFLCDLNELPQWWVPASVRMEAQTDANTRAATRFINGPGFFCGDPRPW